MTAMFCICTTNVSVAARVCPDLACVRTEHLIIKEIRQIFSCTDNVTTGSEETICVSV